MNDAGSHIIDSLFRLLEARRLLMSEGESVTWTALQVGYESPSQFSREYVRKFGSTPGSDARAG